MFRALIFLGLLLTPLTAANTAPKGKLDWEEVSKACAAKYGLHDKSGRNSKAELDCIDYYNAHGQFPPTVTAATRFGDAHNNWIQSLCAGAPAKSSLNQAFQNFDRCMAWAKLIHLSQAEAQQLSQMYGIDRP
jgi:hypothetical protein